MHWMPVCPLEPLSTRASFMVMFSLFASCRLDSPEESNHHPGRDLASTTEYKVQACPNNERNNKE